MQRYTFKSESVYKQFLLKNLSHKKKKEKGEKETEKEIWW